MSIYYGATSQQHVLKCIRMACESISPKTANKAIPLLIGTCCAESGFATYPDGYHDEGRGIMQFDTIRVLDIHDYVLGRGKHMLAIVRERFGIDLGAYTVEELMAMLDVSPLLSAIMCRIGYAMKPDPLPEAGDALAQAEYWKRHWNTEAGAGSPEHYLTQYNIYFAGDRHA